MKNKNTALIANLIISGLGALVCTAQLLSIPTDTKNGSLLGYSPERLALIISTSMVFIFSTYLIFWCQKNQEKSFRFTEKLISINFLYKLILGFCFLITLLCLIFLNHNPDFYGHYTYHFIRIRPLLRLCAIISTQIFAFLIWSKWNDVKAACHLIISNLFQSIPPKLVFHNIEEPTFQSLGMCIIVGALLVLATYKWLPYRQISYWLFYEQSFLGIGCLVCSFLLLFCLLFYNHVILSWLSLFFVIVMLLGTIINVNQFSNLNHYYMMDAPIKRLPSNRLFDYLYKDEAYQVMRYPFFSLIAEYYPNSHLVVDHTLLTNIDVSQEQLIKFGRIHSVEEKTLPIISKKQGERLESLSRFEHEIIMGKKSLFFNFIYVLPETSHSGDVNITMRYLDKGNIIIYPLQLEE